MIVGAPHWTFALATCLALQPMFLSKQVASLDTQRDPARLETAAVVVASSGNAEAIHKLATYLGTRSFLRRLDPDNKGQSNSDHVVKVFLALAEHPNEATEALCIGLAHNPVFVSLPGGLNPLLNALAAVRPMANGAADIFRETSHTDYLSVNGPLLARNASPVALKVLEELFSDESLELEQRVDLAHRSLLPVRTNPAVIAICARMSVSHVISIGVRTAIAETLFDYQPRQWFGVAMNQPVPPSWRSAPEPSLNALRTLGRTLLSQPDVPISLRDAIVKTLDQLP